MIYKKPNAQEFCYSTSLESGGVEVYLMIEIDEDAEYGKSYTSALDAVYYEGVDVTPILSSGVLNALEMEAEKGFVESLWEAKEGY
jgi:hypothetical protein